MCSLAGDMGSIIGGSLRYYRNAQWLPVRYPLLEGCLSLALLSILHAKVLGITAMRNMHQ